MQRTSKWIAAFAAMAIVTALSASPSVAGGGRNFGNNTTMHSKHAKAGKHKQVQSRRTTRHGSPGIHNRRLVPQYGYYYRHTPRYGRHYRRPVPPPFYGYRHHWIPPGHRRHHQHGGYGLVYRYRH